MDFGTALAYYTCVFEYRGGTYVRQFPKTDFPTGTAHAVTDVMRFLDCPVTDSAEQEGVDGCWRELGTTASMEELNYEQMRLDGVFTIESESLRQTLQVSSWLAALCMLLLTAYLYISALYTATRKRFA